jgi:RNA polymerase sigma-70 factor (ECF subfamily)
MSTGTLAMNRLWTWVVPAREADWDALYASQMPRIYNFFRYRVGDGPEAEDLTSVTFEKAWRARHRYRRDLGAFTTWLFAIARNVAIDHYRQIQANVPLEEALDVPAVEAADAAAERRSDAARLSHLLSLLPEREREILSLKYGAGLTNRAIARMTGLSESNVGTIVHRTVALLRAGWNQGA